MKPTVAEFSQACPEVSDSLIREHLLRLPERYFSSFTREELYSHLRHLSLLSEKDSFRTSFSLKRDGSIEVTIFAFDHDALFSLITGILSGTGFNIESGDIFTYERRSTESTGEVSRRTYRGHSRPVVKKRLRKIIDHFSGSLQTSLPFSEWCKEIDRRLVRLFDLIGSNDPDAMTAAKSMVNEMVVDRLGNMSRDGSHPLLYPMKISVLDSPSSFTSLRVVTEDTPGFLYALSGSLSLQSIQLESVRIRTIGSRVEDTFELVDARGRRIEDPETLNRIKLTILLTKQFTYFLGQSPEPFTALRRFEQMVGDLLGMPSKDRFLNLLENPHTLKDLARLLGASDFLWEDFIRLQYETLLPMLEPGIRTQRFASSSRKLVADLEEIFENYHTYEDRKRALNEIKDREIFFLDLDHILRPETCLKDLSRGLTFLAEKVVSAAVDIVRADLSERYGIPATTGGMEASFCVMGLGKLGGEELGYASDIEILFVYSDNGMTDGEIGIANSEYFERFVKGVRGCIEAKRQGIFEIDLRLRPHGNKGPLACSLDNFCRYYGTRGAAHPYERLALVRMRWVAGDGQFGARVERLRDEMIYEAGWTDFSKLWELRERQFDAKGGSGINAKFGTGGLVDLEYGVQILQVMYGKEIAKLRTPRTLEALAALEETGVVSPEEYAVLNESYLFLRLLINAMRMLRGTAGDLFLPEEDSEELNHLARRMGYRRSGGLMQYQQLGIDLETHTAAVRTFVENHFGRGFLPDPKAGGIADLVFSDRVSSELRDRVLLNAGLKNPERGLVNIKSLAGKEDRKGLFARLAVLVLDIIRRGPEPDRALNNFERFIKNVSSPSFHYRTMLSQPMRLEVLLTIFSCSQFLADTLIRNPGFLDWLLMPEIFRKKRTRQELENELRLMARSSSDHADWLNRLRRFRRREILRIGARDISLGINLNEVVEELSNLAGAVAQVSLEKLWSKTGIEDRFSGFSADLEKSFCLMAFGKLGGMELNYSSDIDLLGVYDPSSVPAQQESVLKEFSTRILERLREDLSIHTEEGYAYRVDLRLRPFGSAGELVPSMRGLVGYYRKKAALWEIQAAIKMRPVAGNLKLGEKIVREVLKVIRSDREKRDVVESNRRLRLAAMAACSKESLNVKSGVGGIRDVEFLVQGLQLIWASKRPELITGNTILALEALGEAGILPEDVMLSLRDDYSFLRRVEHYMQLHEDRQLHELPCSETELSAMAIMLSGMNEDPHSFVEQLQKRLERVHGIYGRYLLGEKTSVSQA